MHTVTKNATTEKKPSRLPPIADAAALGRPLSAAEAEALPGMHVGRKADASVKTARKEIERLTKKAGEPKVARTARKVATKKGAPVREMPKASRSDLTPLKVVCGKLDIEPKRARVILRKAIRKGGAGVSHEIGGGRWMLTAAQVETVRAILREYLRAQDA